MSANSAKHRDRAFTLVELVMVLAIAALLAAIAGPRYANSMALYRGQMAANRIAADIALAQRIAKTSSAGETITFTLGSNSYSLPAISGLTPGSSSYTVNIAATPFLASFVSITLGSGTSLTFDRFGQPSCGGTIVVQAGNSQRTITIDPNSGIPTIQ